MHRRTRRFALSLIGVSVIAVVGVAIAAGALGGGRRTFSYFPGPSGSILRCQGDQEREWTFGGSTPHSGGGIPILPRREWGAPVLTYAFSRVPPRAVGDWAPGAPGLEMPAARTVIGDMWFDPARQRVVVGAAGVSLALPGVAPVVPATCRRAFHRFDLEVDFPIEVTAYEAVPAVDPVTTPGCTVTPFGAVEPGAGGSVRRHEWSPDAEGCFTRWWESSDVPRHRYGRYDPPWEFDRIDRRTTIRIAQTGKSKGRFSSRGFLYRRGGMVSGIYWPDLRFRRGSEVGAMFFQHVFGRCVAGDVGGGGAVVELLCVDASGCIWEFPDPAASFGLAPFTAMYGHDPSRAPDSPNEWLRHNVHDIESVLSAIGAPEPRLVGTR